MTSALPFCGSRGTYLVSEETQKTLQWWEKVLEEVCIALTILFDVGQFTDHVPVSCTLHLHSEEPLFKRLVSMSGTSLLIKPLPPFIADSGYTTVLKALNFDNLSAADRITALLNTPIEEFLKLPPTAPMLPMIDDDVIPGMLSFNQISTKGSDPALPGKGWCESLMIGDCKFDVSPNSSLVVYGLG